MKQIVILVVEDEPLLRLDAALEFEDGGFEVRQADNASSALAALEIASDIDVLFTDVDMPGQMDGIALSFLVNDRWPPINIIVTSGHRQVELRDIPDGARFFRKPYQVANIATAAREMAV